MSIQRSDYIGEPQYPAPWTTKQPREGLRDLDEGRIVSLSPDVCLTPIGSSAVPIPYPVVDFCGHDKAYTPSVRFTGKKAMVMRSRTTHVHGDEPGTRKGVKSGTVGDVTEPIGHASEVRAEGSHVIRHLDRFWMNNRNTQGEAVFVRSTQTFAPLLDDDPIPGSLRWNAGDDGRVMSDADPEPLLMNTQYADAGGWSGATATAGNAAQNASNPRTTGGQTAPRPGPVPRGPGTVITPGPDRAPKWHRPPLPIKPPPSVAYRALPWLARLGKFASGAGVVMSVFTPSEVGAPIAELVGDLFPQDDEEWSIVTSAEEAVRSNQMSRDEAVAYSRDAITKYREFLDADHERIRREVESHPRLGDALAHNVRVDTKERRKFPCVVGPYKYVRMICPGEAHHIIPDMVYRIGNAPATEDQKNSHEGRIPDSPTYNQGQAICLSSGMHRTDDEAVHKSLNPALRTLGQRHDPKGTAPLREIRSETHHAINQIAGLPEKCKKLARDAATVQVGTRINQPGRTTIMPPTNPEVIQVLERGSY